MASLSGWAQISFDKDSTFNEGASTDFEIVTKAQLTNSSTDTAFRIIRYNYPNCDFRGSAFCDQLLCYPETTDTADVIIPKDQSFEMKVNFYPDNNEGCCQVKIYVLSLQDGGNVDSCVFNASTTGFKCKLSVDPIRAASYNQNQVYPNPGNGIIRMDTKNNKPFSVAIFDILGNEVLRFNRVLNNQALNVASLPAGIYIIRAEGEYISSSKFRKI